MRNYHNARRAVLCVSTAFGVLVCAPRLVVAVPLSASPSVGLEAAAVPEVIAVSPVGAEPEEPVAAPPAGPSPSSPLDNGTLGTIEALLNQLNSENLAERTDAQKALQEMMVDWCMSDPVGCYAKIESVYYLLDMLQDPLEPAMRFRKLIGMLFPFNQAVTMLGGGALVECASAKAEGQSATELVGLQLQGVQNVIVDATAAGCTVLSVAPGAPVLEQRGKVIEGGAPPDYFYIVYCSVAVSCGSAVEASAAKSVE